MSTMEELVEVLTLEQIEVNLFRGRSPKDEVGRIFVDGEPTRFTVGDQLYHRILAARHIAACQVGPRPVLWDAMFASPCAYCPFSKVCDAWDQGEIESPTSFVEIAKQSIQEVSK